jgi:GNAT superfamily N-acetyltransferase
MLTGAGFHEDHVLDDGTLVTLRHVRPDDAAELKRAFDKLSPSSRYRRFLGGQGTTLSDSALRYLTHVDGRDHVAIVAMTKADGAHAGTGLGIARYIRTTDEPTVAEAAVTVIDPMQHKGLGRLLAIGLARAALERGVRRFRGTVLADNRPVRLLLEELGAVVRPADDGYLLFEVDLAADNGPTGIAGIEDLMRRLLRAASSRLVGLIRGLGLGPSPGS